MRTDGALTRSTRRQLSLWKYILANIEALRFRVNFLFLYFKIILKIHFDTERVTILLNHLIYTVKS